TFVTVADNRVNLSVAIEIAHGDRFGVGDGGRINDRLEGAVSDPEQYADRVTRVYDNVEYAVAVDIPGSDIAGATLVKVQGIINGSLESAVSVAQQDADVVVIR